MVVANIAAPPTPCTARAAISRLAFVARPLASDAAANTARPARYTSRRPRRSPSEPSPISRAARATA